MHRATLVLNTLVVALSAAAASAQTFNLAADFSETANPNWQWTFVRASTPLQKFMHSPHPLNPAAANGFWGIGPNSQYESAVLKVTADATLVGGTVNDFLAGDVVVHGSNPGNGDLEIRWGGQVRGSVTVTGTTWYAHGAINRVAVYELRHNAAVLASGQISQANNRANPIGFDAGGAVTLAAGDTIRLAFLPAPGQTFASLAGVDLTVNFTPHPCPADLTFGAIAGGPGYGVKNGILNNDDFFYYLGQFAAGNLPVADLTTGAIPGQPGYGVPNGILNNEDFFYYLAIFAAGCP
jgi:hypothetical protein